MALVFVAEDGTGRSDANSLASVAAADSYYDTVPPTWAHAVEWAEADEASKQVHLVKATDLIRALFRFSGTRVSSTQRLPFPRYDVWVDRVELSSTSVPDMVIFAVAELAGHLMVRDRTAEPATKGIKSLGVDVIRIEFDKADRAWEIPDSVLTLLADFGEPVGGDGMITLERV